MEISMEYKILTVSAICGFSGDTGIVTDFQTAADSLSKRVNQDIRAGWAPLGGVATGLTQQLNEPYLFQAMVRK